MPLLCREFDSNSMEREASSMASKCMESQTEGVADASRNRAVVSGKISAVGKMVAAMFGDVYVCARESFVGIKRAAEDQWIRYGCGGEDAKVTRTYQVWPGNNVFFFHGRLICGPDPRGLLLTAVSIILSSWIFSLYVGYNLPSHSTLYVTICVVLTVMVLVCLILVSALDPGIIPREEVGSSYGARRKKVTVNGVEFKLKYCQICKIFRPPRSCHCAVCDNCVEKFDHHCPWIGQCVAVRNYRFYLTFVGTALLFFIYIFALSCWRLHEWMLKNDRGGLFGMLRNCPETLALTLFSFAAIGFLGGLAVFHAHLIAINQTAYENFRQRFVGSPNPHDKGILCNIKEVLFSPVQSSGVDFRAEVNPSS